MTLPRPRALAALLLATLFSTSACGETVMPTPKRNPNPSQVYEVTFTVRDAPGPIEFTEGFARYEVTDEDCLPYSDPIAGVKQRPMAEEPLRFEKVGESSYRTRVVADPFVDEDYFGLGVCRWEFIAVNTRRQSGTTLFLAHALGRNIVAGRGETLWYGSNFYARADLPTLPVGGGPDPDVVRNGTTGPLFSITSTVRKLSDGN